MGVFVLRDEGSTKGTTVNGNPVTAKEEIALEPASTRGRRFASIHRSRVGYPSAG